jgi:hypothetical protein
MRFSSISYDHIARHDKVKISLRQSTHATAMLSSPTMLERQIGHSADSDAQWLVQSRRGCTFSDEDTAGASSASNGVWRSSHGNRSSCERVWLQKRQTSGLDGGKKCPPTAHVAFRSETAKNGRRARFRSGAGGRASKYLSMTS